MGAVLQQLINEDWQPLTFFSKKYSAYDRELLAIYEAVKHFRHMLEARHFTIFTDHHHGPGAAIRIATLQIPGQHVWCSILTDNSPPPRGQWARGTLPPDTEGSHHAPRRSTLDRGASPGSPRNSYSFQGGSSWPT
jgi:hypothetical protein